MLRNRDGKKLIRHNAEVANWDNACKNGDENGFYKLIDYDGNGNYVKYVILEKGTIISRYGDPGGHFSAPPDVSYLERSLPYTYELTEYHEYKVKKQCVIKYCIVKEGIAAPSEKFNTPGMGIQYQHEQSISELVEEKILKEVYLWVLKTYLKKIFK